MKISVITWDASFRESFHTVDSFGLQNFSKDEYEFIWVDYHNNDNPLLIEKINKYPNTRILNLNRPKNEKWHLGRCINEGVKAAKGEILIIPDGDVIVPQIFLEIIDQELTQYPNLVTYFRRWDEPSTSYDPKKSYDIDYLTKNCQLTNPTNYAGTIALTKEVLNSVNGYEENEVFCGAGVQGLELYTRLRNANYPIKWHSQKIFHPYHNSTGFSDKQKELDNELFKSYSWYLPYAGLEQSWIVHSRSKSLTIRADKKEVENLLKKMPKEIINPSNNKYPTSLKTKLLSLFK